MIVVVFKFVHIHVHAYLPAFRYIRTSQSRLPRCGEVYEEYVVKTIVKMNY